MSRLLADWLETLEGLHPADIELGLERCGAVWTRLGAPRPAPRVVTVAGTNGKGSVCAYLEAGFRALGLRTGCYTSPHVFRFNERIRVDGDEAADEALVEAFEAIEAVRGSTPLTFFEFTTLAAFRFMAQQRCDVAVLEVGLGGRLDAVNLVDPDAAVITPIGLDHVEWLGPDREHIAREKAGILRAGRPGVCGDPDPPAALVDRAREIGAPLALIGRDFSLDELPGEGCAFLASSARLAVPCPVMAGAHQRANFATALAALDVAWPSWRDRSDAVAQAMADARLRGRLERVAERPEIIVDVGHNPMAAERIANLLGAAGRPVHVVVAMLRDKDATACARALDPVAERWYCAGLSGPRGQSGAALAEHVDAGVAEGPVEAFDHVGAALDAALRACPPIGTVLVFGSFLTAEQALRHLRGGLAPGVGDAARI